jgi:uncharacterized RmlC-like cupin family protein
MTDRISNLLVAVAASAALLTTGAALAEFDPSREVTLPRAQLNYVNINPAIQMAGAFGNMSEGAHGTFGKFPANFDSGAHTHTGAYHGIVLKGVMTNPFKSQTDAPQMEAGSYWFVPAGSEHSTACVSDTPCEFFFFADEKFDFLTVE